jgi:peroxiredoxin (alkyl hydroperoxide reductase subunit C)
VRAVFVIDPKGIIRTILYYPMNNGRNMEEIKRLLIGLQQVDEHDIATPANWQPGDDVIVPPPKSAQEADQRVAKAGGDYQCIDWFLSTKKAPPPKKD